MKQSENRNGTFLRTLCAFLFAALAFYAGISLLVSFAHWALPFLDNVSISLGDAATIGIIGGADGPTAIFLTGSTATVWKILLKFLLLIIGILGWHHWNKRK